MLCGISSEFRKASIYGVNVFLFYTISFIKTLNFEMQICQMDVGAKYWNEKKKLLKQDVMTLSS